MLPEGFPFHQFNFDWQNIILDGLTIGLSIHQLPYLGRQSYDRLMLTLSPFQFEICLWGFLDVCVVYTTDNKAKLLCDNGHCLFLAHLSTKCSGWAIVTGLCPSSVVVLRASSVVRKLFYLNIFSSETTHWILTKLHRNDPWVVPYQNCSNGSDWLHK